jgi:hypothetical protein
MVEPTHRELLAHLRVLLHPSPLGTGPIRLEAWNERDWSPRQREAFIALRAAAGLAMVETP